MKILVINTGSSSIKYQLFDMAAGTVSASGLIERIGETEGGLLHTSVGPSGQEQQVREVVAITDHRAGLRRIAELLVDTKRGAIKNRSEIAAVGHRVVHGGERFHAPTIIDETVIEAIKENISLAPLHNQPNLTGITIARKIFPDALHVAVFDTAFHQTIPRYAFLYAVPLELYEKHHVRRYGFHGTSHVFVAEQAAEYVQKPLNTLNMITVHLGNGASIAAIKKGKCIDTTMGMTPLEGLVMGTRSGDIDPALPFFLADHLNLSLQQIDTMLNKESGLKGLCGTNDMRELLDKRAAGDERAADAFEVYTYRIKKYLGAYFAVLGSLDVLVFTAGIGENSPEVRAECCRGLENLGIIIDNKKNRRSDRDVREVSASESGVRIVVVPTNEELEIARETESVCRSVNEG